MMETSVTPFRAQAVAGVTFGIDAGGLGGALDDAGDGAGENLL